MKEGISFFFFFFSVDNDFIFFLKTYEYPQEGNREGLFVNGSKNVTLSTYGYNRADFHLNLPAWPVTRRLGSNLKLLKMEQNVVLAAQTFPAAPRGMGGWALLGHWGAMFALHNSHW